MAKESGGQKWFDGTTGELLDELHDAAALNDRIPQDNRVCRVNPEVESKISGSVIHTPRRPRLARQADEAAAAERKPRKVTKPKAKPKAKAKAKTEAKK